MNKNVKRISSLTAGGRDFIQIGIWRIRLKDLDRKNRFLVRNLRVLLLAAGEFVKDKCPIRSSALTFYSILSIVPVMAMAFAVAIGFGFQKVLEKELLEQFAGQQDVISRVMEYARTLLEQTKGGLLAGIGAVMLLWAAIKVMSNIEQSFNDIWASTTQRSLGKKFSDYLSIILISPLLLILSGSATVLIVSQLTIITEKISVLGIFSPIIMFLLKLLPYGVIWALFTFIYVFMPNTRVSIKSGLVGGVIAGTAFKLLQWAYLFFQVGVSRYNAIYGSFAALPLFLIWLNSSWLIVLFGAELSFAHQNVDEYELESDRKKISDAFRRILSLSVAHLVVKNFQKGEKPLSASRIAVTLDMPVRMVRMILDNLFESGLIAEAVTGRGEEAAWLPARDINSLTILSVLEALDKNGVNELPIEQSRELRLLSESVNAFYDEIRKSPANAVLKDI